MIAKKQHGVICPLRCGQCCEYWRDVPDLVADAAMRPNAQTCPHEGARGCKLARVDRPAECVDYLCGVGLAVLSGQISRPEGIRLKEHCHIEVPKSYPLRAVAGGRH